MANFEAILQSITLSINLLFLKSGFPVYLNLPFLDTLWFSKNAEKWEKPQPIKGKKFVFHQKMGFIILCSNFFALLLTKISPLQTDQEASSSVIDVSPNLSYQQQHQPILLLSLHCLCILWFLRMINASIQSQTNKKIQSRFLNILTSEL